MNRKVIIGFIVMAMSLFGFSQEDYVSIEGKVIDVETKRPLGFATINVQNTPIGVVANEYGSFTFTFSKKHLKDSIVFSSAGYQSEKLLAQKILSEDSLLIELADEAIVLAEVVVTNKEFTAWEILQLALDNVKHNYPSDPFEFQAFYRDYKQENEECISIFEAAISVYDKGYTKVANKFSFKEKVVLDQVRKSLSVEYRTHVFKRVNVMKELLRLNDIRYQSRALDKKAARFFTYKMDGYEVINDRLMYKIKAKDVWEYCIYVDVITYAIPRITMDFKWEDETNENRWTIGDTVKYHQPKSSMVLEMQMINGLYYPKYCQFTANLEAYDRASNELLFTSYLMQEYMVTDINFNPDEKPEKADRMDPYAMIEDQKFSYDPEFWKNYNVIKLHPRDKKLINGLEEKMELEKQFASQGKGK